MIIILIELGKYIVIPKPTIESEVQWVLNSLKNKGIRHPSTLEYNPTYY